MADAFIYFRLESNSTDKANINVPANLPSDQKLVFTLPDELLESVTMLYENNIKDTPISNPDGTRRINKQDNGLNGITFTFRGRFKDPSVDITKLKDFAVRPQVEASGVALAMEFGIFGYFTDNTTIRPFNLDPLETKGLTIRSFNINRVGGVPKNFDFDITMTFGGTFT